MSKRITAHDILQLLRQKHKDDMLFCEIGQGSERRDAGSGGNRLDAWAVSKSWSQPHYIGYEVKVSRADFLADNKWPGYLASCSQFYFVTAPGVCDVSEIGKEAGLMVMASTGSRFTTKKKAPRLKINEERVFNMLKIALMRACPSKKTEGLTPEETLAILEAQEEEKLIGQKIGTALGMTKRRLDRMEQDLKRREETARLMEALMQKAGISSHELSFVEETAEKKLRAFVNGLGSDLRKLRRHLEQAGYQTQQMVKNLDEHVGKHLENDDEQ